MTTFGDFQQQEGEMMRFSDIKSFFGNPHTIFTRWKKTKDRKDEDIFL